MSSWWEENMLNVIPQINSQFDMRSTSTCIVVYHFFLQSVIGKKWQSIIGKAKKNFIPFDTFLGRHHICRPLDTTLDISQRFLRFSF